MSGTENSGTQNLESTFFLKMWPGLLTPSNVETLEFFVFCDIQKVQLNFRDQVYCKGTEIVRTGSKWTE